jgi:hypothetical protein
MTKNKPFAATTDYISVACTLTFIETYKFMCEEASFNFYGQVESSIIFTCINESIVDCSIYKLYLIISMTLGPKEQMYWT